MHIARRLFNTFTRRPGHGSLDQSTYSEMLGDTDRARSTDLQVDNPSFTPSDDGEPAELMDDEPAEQKQQQRGTVFAVFSEVLAFGRMPKVAHQFVMATWVVCAISYGPGATVPFFIATVIGYMDPSALLWLNSALCAAGILFFSLVFGSLRLAVAPGGGLELLGINEVELSAESIKSLKIWRVLLFNTFALPWVAFAVLCLALPLLMSRTRIALSATASQWANSGSFCGFRIRSPCAPPRSGSCSCTRGS